jgi:DNA polymerase III epsilon subunit-like protein
MFPAAGDPTTRELVVLDFKTTGLTPAFDRTIEVAATLLVDHRPMETFHQLMHPGHPDAQAEETGPPLPGRASISTLKSTRPARSKTAIRDEADTLSFETGAPISDAVH